MRKVVPGIAIIAVIFANRPPLPLAEIGTPLLPGHMGLAGFIQTLLFRSFDELGFHGAQSPSVVRTGPWRALHVHFRLGRTMPPREFAGRLQSPCMPFVLVMDASERISVGLKKRAYLICVQRGKVTESRLTIVYSGAYSLERRKKPRDW